MMIFFRPEQVAPQSANHLAIGFQAPAGDGRLAQPWDDGFPQGQQL